MCLSRDAALSAPMLDIDEEKSAIRLWQDHGDRRALEILIRSHARLAWSVARRWTDNPAHLEDLVAAGMIGLVRAAERFDRTRDVRFATYSVWWIRNEVTDALPRVRGVVDVPLRAASTSQAVTIVHGQLALDAAPGEDDLDILGSLPADDPGPEEQMLSEAADHVMCAALAEALAALPTLELTGNPIVVYEPYVEGTQDEKQFRVVKDRERWFNVVMGEKMELDEWTTDRLAERVPLPEGLARRLTMRLGVWDRRTAS